MILDELIGRLLLLRKDLGGDVKVGLHPTSFDSARPTIATNIEIKDVEYNIWRATAKEWTTNVHKNMVVIS